MPVTTLNTPSGKPACLVRAANSSVLAEANSDGLITTVQPAASAAAHLKAMNSSGEFHAVSAATTPTGSCRVKANMSALSIGTTEPSVFSASPPKYHHHTGWYFSWPRKIGRASGRDRVCEYGCV